MLVNRMGRISLEVGDMVSVCNVEEKPYRGVLRNMQGSIAIVEDAENGRREVPRRHVYKIVQLEASDWQHGEVPENYAEKTDRLNDTKKRQAS